MLPKTLLLSTFLPSVLAVSLADFIPRVSNLPSQCQYIYTANIDMCQPSDFQNKKCSQNCVNALDALRASVSKACSGVTGPNILAALMAGQGTQNLCPNWADYSNGNNNQPTGPPTPPPAPALTSSRSSPQSSITSSQVPSSTTDGPQSSSSDESNNSGSSTQSTTVVIATNTVVPQPSDTSVPSSIRFDSNTPPAVASTATRTTSSDGSSATSVNDGGSPFSGVEPGMEALGNEAGSRGAPELLALALAVVGAVMLRL